MERLARNFYRLLMALACLSMVITFLAVLLGIVARQAAWDIPGLDAYAGYAIAATLFLALPGTLVHGDHIRVTLLLDRLPPRLRGALEWWCLGAGLTLALYLAGYALHLVWVSRSTHDVSPAADASPLWIPQLAMALGCIGFALAFAHALVARARGQVLIARGREASHIE